VKPFRAAGARRDTYRNFRKLPEGSTVLYQAENVIFGEDVVQKSIRATPGSLVFQEPWLLKQFEHPHITQVFEAQFDPENENLVVMIMPVYLGGSVARALVDGHRFSLHESMAIVRDGLDALEYTHARHGVAHRDIKPGNVLLDETRSEGFLADFSAAALFEDDGKAPWVVGTYEYMAPECARTGRHGPEADVYGFGMVLFEMVNGRLRWEEYERGRIEDRVLAGRRALPDAAYAPARFAPVVPLSLVRVIRKAIHPEPANRFSSAAEMLSAINRVVVLDWRHVEGEGLDGRWEGGWPPHAAPERRDVYSVDSEIVPRGRAKGRRRLVARYWRPGAAGWRRIGVDDRDAEPDDIEAIRSFFSEVEASAAHRRPAR